MLNRKLGRKIGHRKSLIRNLAASLVLYERIDTTLAKAKEVRSVVEKMISISKDQNLSAYRQLLSFFYDKNAAKKVYNELAIRYKDRQSGFLRVYHLGNRLGDNAKIARIELIDRKVFVAPRKSPAAETKKETVDVDAKSKLTRTERASQKRLDKLTSREQKSGIVTTIRSKAARKTGT